MNSSLCPLFQKEECVEDYLKEMGFSKNSLRKLGLKKSFLNKSIPKVLDLPLDLLNRGEVNPSYEGPSVEVIFEDQNFIAIEKPSGVHTHPFLYSEKDNCLSLLREKGFGRYLSAYSDSYEKGLLFRLDQVTSGVLIYVKDPILHEYLRENFSEVSKSKTYLCIVEGEFSPKGSYSHEFSFSGKGNNHTIVGSGELIGEIEVSSLKFNSKKNLSLVEVALKTGIRHQIRSQLAHLGYPIVGDVKYGGKGASRVYLHAARYVIKASEVDIDIKSGLIDFFSDLDRCI